MNDEFELFDYPRFVQFLIIGVAFILAILWVWLLLVSFSAAIFIALGVLVGVIMIFWQNITPAVVLSFIFIVVFLFLGSFVFGWLEIPQVDVSLNRINMCNLGDKKSVLKISGYSAEVEPINYPKDLFHVNQQIQYKLAEMNCVENSYHVNVWSDSGKDGEKTERFRAANVEGKRKGLFVYETYLPNETNVDYNDCCTSDTVVKLVHFPYQSFYDAKYAEKITVDEYFGEENITWIVSNPGDGIRFAYLPSPYYNIRWLLVPLIEFSKNDNWVLAIIGFAISSTFLLIIKPNVVEFINDKLKSVFKKDDNASRRKPPKRRSNRNP